MSAMFKTWKEGVQGSQDSQLDLFHLKGTALSNITAHGCHVSVFLQSMWET